MNNMFSGPNLFTSSIQLTQDTTTPTPTPPFQGLPDPFLQFQTQLAQQFQQHQQNVSQPATQESQQFTMDKGASTAHLGEQINSRCSLYHTITELATVVQEQQTLSIDTKSAKAKVFLFKNQNIIAMMQGDMDIQLIINQEDQLSNVLRHFHQQGSLAGNIIDFTMVNNSLLYLLYQQNIIIVDIKPLLQKSPILNGNPQIVDHIQLKEQGLYFKMEVGFDNKYLVLTSKIKANILQINLATQEQFNHTIPNEDQRSVRAIDFHKHYLCVLYDKNEVIVYDMLQKERTFRSLFRDATSQITNLFYLEDFDDDVDLDEGNEDEYNRFMDDEVVNDEDDNAQPVAPEKPVFKGHFLFVEQEIGQQQKPSPSPKKETRSSAKYFFQKICLARVINKTKKGSNPEQSLHQEDFLKISERTSKIAEYDRKRGIVFLLNKEKSDKFIRLYCIKLRQVDNADSDSDDGRKHKHHGQGEGQGGFNFSYIRELKLELNYSVNQAINTGTGYKKPKYMKILRKPLIEEKPEEFFIYTSIGKSILAHSLKYTDLIPATQQQTQPLAATFTNPFNNSIFSHNPFPGIPTPQFSLSDLKPQDTSQQVPFGIIPTTDQKSKKMKSQQKFLDNDQSLQDQQAILEQLMSLKTSDVEEVKVQHPINMEDLREDEHDAKMESELVKQEMQRAIENEIKELENPTMIKSEVDIMEGGQSGFKDDEAKAADSPPKVNPQAFQPTQPAGKKKKNKKNKAQNQASMEVSSTRAQLGTKYQPINGNQQMNSVNQFLNMIQSQQPIQQQQQFQIQNPPKILQAPQQMQVSNKKQKSQADQLVDNYQEMTNKYKDLSQKLQQIQDQLQNQKNQQDELDRCIQKNLKQLLPSMIEEQLKVQVSTVLVQHIKSVDQQIREDVMPAVEQQMSDMMLKLVQNQQFVHNAQPNGASVNQIGSINIGSANEQQIRQIVAMEFQSAMENSIKPMLEDQFKSLIEDVQTSLQYVNHELTTKLRSEEDKNRNVLNYYIEKLDQIQQQQAYAQHPQPMYPSHIPPPNVYMNPYYPPPMQAYPQYAPPLIPPKKELGIGTLKPSKIDPMGMHKTASYQQSFNPLFNQSMMGGLSQNKSFIERRLSNKFVDSDDENEGLNPGRVRTNDDSLRGQQVLGQPQRTPMNQYGQNMVAANGQQILMFNDEEIPSESRRQSENVGSSFPAASNFMRLQQQNQPTPLGQFQLKPYTGDSQTLQNDKNLQLASPLKKTASAQGEFAHIIQFIKKIANDKPSQLGPLFSTPKMFEDMKTFLTYHSDQLGNQHANIIFQFMKKLFDKAKETPTVRKQGYQIFRLFFHRVCQRREDIQPRIDVLKQMGDDFQLLASQA